MKTEKKNKKQSLLSNCIVSKTATNSILKGDGGTANSPIESWSADSTPASRIKAFV